MRAQIVAVFLGLEAVPSADGTKTYYRVGILQGMRAKMFNVDADTYAKIASKGFKLQQQIVADVEIVEGREKTFIRLLDLNVAEK